jgi:ribose transport system substrate-binding protein
MNTTSMKRLAVALSLTSALFLTACGSTPTASPSPGGETGDVKGKKVTLLTVAQSCDYCAKHTEEFKKVAEAAGVQVTVVVNDFNASEQAQQVNQAISTRPDAIVLWPADATAITPSLQRLKQSKIPVVVTNSHPQSDDESLWNAFTGPDDYANGQEAAKAMIAGFKEKGFGDSGSVVIVEGVPGTPPAISRTKGFKDELAKSAPGVTVAGSQPGNWDQTQATSAAASLITQFGSKDLRGIYAQADNMLAGAIVAADRAGLKSADLAMVGSNCSIEGYTNIEKGVQYASVLQSPIEDGEYAAKAVIDVLAGKSVEKNQYLTPKTITKANLADCAAAVGK